ncbi:MAG: SWIM zinc finger family protein, partial [Ferruginibacter sp.]|nr:SWIM zinc finger family protein [Ferruginibacter sp.]
MALPHIIKHIYNNGAEEVIRRGKKINQLGFVELIEHDELTSTVVFRVKDDNYSTFYKVYIQKYTDPKSMTLRCGCPYNLGDICRHEAAALFRLQDMVDKNLLLNDAIQFNQLHTVAKMKYIDLKMIKMLSSPSIYEEAEKLLRTSKANILHAANERVEAEVVAYGDTYPLVIQKNDERNFDTSCTCAESMHPLCEHKVMLFLQILNAYGANYFDSIRNWDKEKSKLLQLYGYNLADDLTGKFEFTYKEGKPFLKVLDPSIKRVAGIVSTPPQPVKSEPAMQEVEIEEEERPAKQLGIVFNFNYKIYPGFKIDAIQGEANDDFTDF